MTTIKLGCSGCDQKLLVPVTDDEGPWSEEDEESLMRVAAARGWLAFIEYGDSAYVYCPQHRAEGLVRA